MARAARSVLAVLAAAGVAVAALQARPARAFGFDDVAALAQREAKKPYRAPDPIPADLRNLTYDQYRDIRFRPDHALWRADGLPFEVMFFHLGRGTLPVRINEVTSKVQRVAYDSANFDYGKNTLNPKAWRNLDFAGFRVHYPLNTDAYKDEVIVFLGASYFRALPAHMRYGLSARGLAVDTVGANGEEFPRFTEFWLVKPAPDARTLTIFALLDSQRMSGAYEFDLHPGDETIVDVRLRLYLRENVKTLGIAPLTSMFDFGENEPHPSDFRPEVHDSDGLMVATGAGEWIWRPLINPPATLTTSFSMEELRGFGLMQRDRDFRSYEDSEARYELRPSAWVEPIGSWGAGRVELVQISTPDETNDNVVAYWVPAHEPPPGEPLDFSYRLHWQGVNDKRPPGGWVVQTRIGHGFVKVEPPPDEQQYVVDFKGPALEALAADAPVKAVVSAPSNGEILESNAYRVEATGAWRMTVRFKRLDPSQPTELRGFLQSGNDVLTETWSNLVPPR